jgi:hypothetical protein
MRAIAKACSYASVLGVIAIVASPALAFPIAAPGTEGFSIIVSSTDPVIATYQGTSASFSDDLFLDNTGEFLFNNHSSAVGSTVDLGSFAIGTELLFRLHVNNTGFDYFTGPASRNPDNMPHARVQSDFEPDTALVSFEDLFNVPEGSRGYNDLSFTFTNTAGGPISSVPEAGSLALLGIGLLGLLSVRRRTPAAACS